MKYSKVGKWIALRAVITAFLAAALFLSLGWTTGPAGAASTTGTLASPDGLLTYATESTVAVAWNAVRGASQFRVYRSTTEGMGYSLVTTVAADAFQSIYFIEDKGLTNQTTYYYVVTALDALGAESVYSNEVAGMPHLVPNWSGTIDPQDYGSYVIGSPDPVTITGKLHIPFHTGPDGPAPGVTGQLGYGPAGTAPSSWTHWVDAAYIGIAGNETPLANDWYSATFRPEAPGDYNTVFRFTTSLGLDWIYGGFTTLDPNLPASSNNVMGTLHVIAGGDTTPPGVPGDPSLVSVTSTSATITWGPSTDNIALYRYEILRASSPAGTDFVLAGSVDAAAPLQFQDTGLVAGTSYYYVVRAVDTSFNRSANSNGLSVATSANLVTVNLQVTVPAFTPAGDAIYINQAVNPDGSLGPQSWTALALTPDAAPGTFKTTLMLKEGIHFAFLFSRGSQSTVQTNADGDSPALAPNFIVAAGMAPVQRAVLNWDDPLVVDHWPAGGSVEMIKPLSVTWSQPMPAATSFTVRDITSGGAGVAFPGTFRTDPATRRTTFTPTGSFTAGRSYAASVSGQPGMNGVAQQAPLNFTFNVLLYHVMIPIVGK